MNRRFSQNCHSLIVALLFFVAWPWGAFAQETPNPLAVPQWRGYTPRWIGLYGSQLADLIPESFRPISISDLASALRDDSLQMQPPSDVPIPRLTVIAHVVSENIVSWESRLELPAESEGTRGNAAKPRRSSWQPYPLGTMNLQLVKSSHNGRLNTAAEIAKPHARILSGADGNSFAWGKPEETIDFAWSVRGQHTARGRRWTLQLPAATTTRFFLSVAKGQDIVVGGGSAKKLAETPPWTELGLDPRAVERLNENSPNNQIPMTWYSIEPTPGQQLVLMQLRSDEGGTAADSMNVIRGCHMQSQLVGDQLRWTWRMPMDASSSFQFTELAWADGEVTKVRRDNVAIPFVWTGNSARWNEVPVAGGPDGAAPLGKLSMTSTMWVFEGVSRRIGDRLPLPRPLLPADRFVVPPQMWHLQLDLPHWGELSAAQLPPAWNIRRLPPDNTKPVDLASQKSSDHDLGVDHKHEPVVTWMASGPTPSSDDPWSVSISSNDTMVFADHQIRFEMDESSIAVRGKIVVETPHDAIGPITFELQDGFQFEFVGVGEGRRSVPTGTAAGHGRKLTIWPGGDEVTENRVTIYVNGRARRTNAVERSELDPTSLSDPTSPDETTPPPMAAGEGVAANANEQIADSQASPLDAVGRENGAARSGDGSVQSTEPLWLMRAVDCPGQLLATIVPPAGLSWSAQAAIEPSRITFTELSAAQRRFFAPLPGDAIVFGGAIEATPQVTLEKPDVNLSVSLRTLLRTAPRTLDVSPPLQRAREMGGSSVSDERAPLWQTLEVRTEGTAGEIRTMRLRFAARLPEDRDSSRTRPNNTGKDSLTDNNAPSESSSRVSDPPAWVPMQWFVRLQPGQAETPLAERAVRRHYVEGAEDWEVRIDLPLQFTNQSILVGRRRVVMPMNKWVFPIGLPNVPDSASQSAEIWIDSSLQLSEHPETLKGVPVVEANWSDHSTPRVTTSDIADDTVSSPSTIARYRYSPNDQPWIVVTPRAHRPPRGLIVDQRLVVNASVNGTDTLRMTCLARSRSEILLTFPPSMHMIDLRCDGELVAPHVVPGRGVIITLPGTSSPPASSATPLNADSEQSAASPGGPLLESSQSSHPWRRLEMNWVSQTPLSQWYRWYHFPEIEFDQMVVDTRFELSAADGTRLLQAPDFARPWFSGSAPLLVQTGFVAGIGWVAALLLLGLGCLASRHGFGILGSGILLSAVAIVLWPSVAISLVAFVAVPLTLAALQRSTALWRSRGADDSEMNGNASSKQPSHSQFSNAANALWWISFTILCVNPSGGAGRVVGQETGKPSFNAATAPNPRGNTDPNEMSVPGIDVLVPLQGDGKLLGNKIYIPEAFYNDLYFGGDRSLWHDPMIDRVSYRLQLSSPLKGKGSLTDAGGLFGEDAFASNALSQIWPREVTGDTGQLSDEILSERNVAVLRARMQLTLPENVRRIRMPYEFKQIRSVTQLNATGDPMTVRWGGDNSGGAWVDIPVLGRDVETVELLISLRCQFQWKDPCVLVSCDLPNLPAADLVVTASDVINNVMMLTPTTSWFVDLPTRPAGGGLPRQVNSTSSVAVVESDERESDVILLGSQRQLKLQFQFEPSVAAAIATPGIGPREPSGTNAQSATVADHSTLPWYDETQWQQRYWVHVGSGKTVVECELESLQSLPPEVILSLATVAPQVISIAPDGEPSEPQGEKASSQHARLQSPPPCVLLGTHWSCLSRDDNPSMKSRNLRLVSLSSPSRAIRLAWTLQTPNRGSWRIQLPRVWLQPNIVESDGDAIEDEGPPMQHRGNENLPPSQSVSPQWIAWSFASDVKPDWSTLVESEPIAVDQFYSKWTGFLSSIDYVTKGDVRELSVSQESEARWSIDSMHDISIQPNAQRVHYTAHVTAPESKRPNPGLDSDAPSSPLNGASRYVIPLPARARLLDWRFESEGNPSVTPHSVPPELQSESSQSSVQIGDSAIPTDGVSSPDLASLDPPIWALLRGDGVTTLYLTTDKTSFDITVDVIIPSQTAKKTNKLGLIDIKKMSSARSSRGPNGEGNSAHDQFDGLDDVSQTNELQITRHVDTIVKWVHPINAIRVDTAVADAASLLANGEIVVDRFRSEGAISNNFDTARFRTSKNGRPFNVDSRISLSWSEGRWMAQADCQVTSSYCPDYIDIAIPTRWCESLRIDPRCVSSRQPTLDPAMQVLRLQLRNEPAGDRKSTHTRTFQLTSRLAVSDITRVSVPELRIISARQHRIDVVVPTRLTNEQVRWHSNFAGPIEKPRWRIQSHAESTPASDDPGIESSQEPDTELSVYAVTNPRWSIDLETLPRTDRVARLLHTDHSVIVQPNSESLLMVSRFDIVPGDQPVLRLSIDRSVELQGVWAATQQADLQTVPTSARGRGSLQSDGVVWEVSLPLSRLSQTVEVLTSLPRHLPDVLLPSLNGLSRDVPRVSVNWSQRPASTAKSARTIDEVIGSEKVTTSDTDPFHNDPRAAALIASPMPPRTRVAWLASNVVKAIRTSSDSLADRRDDEVAVWLGPWIARYRLLCDAAGRQIGDDRPDGAVLLKPTDSKHSADTSLGIPAGDLLSWEEMDSYIVAQETRYFPRDTFANGNSSLTWTDDLAIAKPPGYADRWTFAWSGRRLPIQVFAVQRPPLSEQTRQLVLRSGLFFVLFSLLMLATLLPRRKHSEADSDESERSISWAEMTLNPSLWLFVLGIIGLILMPLPMALGVLVVSLVFGASQAKRWIVSRWKMSMQKRASM